MGETKNIKGLVLCGGESKRMGRDKGQMRIGEISWAEHMASKLRAVDLEVLISVNSRQLGKYHELFPSIQLVADNGLVQGPLGGVLSVHERFPDSDLLVLGCDLLDMDLNTLKELLEVHASEPDYEYYTYVHGGIIQTLCSIYTSRGLKKTAARANEHQLERYSLHSLPESGLSRRLEVQNGLAFRNYNQL